jgi:hypothetical protein
MPTETSCRRSSTPAQTATILLLTLLAGAASAAAKPKEFSKIDAVIEQKMKAHLIPGIAVVIMRGDEVVHSFASGSGASGPITPDTPFIIGSLSKLFTATAVMQLVDAGLVELDAPVERYLPGRRPATAAEHAASRGRAPKLQLPRLGENELEERSTEIAVAIVLFRVARLLQFLVRNRLAAQDHRDRILSVDRRFVSQRSLQCVGLFVQD